MDLDAAAAQHRRELHVHCYRMLGSFDDAEDAVQETFLRAWKARDAFDGVNLRAWLYKIATNVCLDVRRQARRGEVSWLTAYPDRLLDETPESVAVDRETIELAFLAAVQTLPPRQRAALIVRDVLGWSAADTAALLDTSVPATNSALQRARAAMQQQLPARRSEWRAAPPSAGERALLDAFVDAHERCDAAAAAAVVTSDIRVTMPPMPYVFEGAAQLATLLERAFGPDREGDWRLLPTAANRMPAAASYLRRPGDTVFRAFKMDVLHPRGDRIAEITTFGYVLFPHFGLPSTLPG